MNRLIFGVQLCPYKRRLLQILYRAYHQPVLTYQLISGLSKGNHDRDGVWISDLNLHRFLRFYFSVFSLVLVSIEKIYQTLKAVFDLISKHVEVRQKYSAARRIFNSLLGV